MSKYFYSPSLHTFLVEGIHPKRPGDCVEVRYADYSYLLAKQSEGLQIVFDSHTKQPVARLAPGTTKPEQMQSLYRQKNSEINTACETAITGGFWSLALGTPYQYPSKLDDQLNLTGLILQGFDSPYGCRDEQGVKELRSHTAKQLRQISEDFTTFKMELLQRANQLKQQLDQAMADGDLGSMEVVTWESLQS